MNKRASDLIGELIKTAALTPRLLKSPMPRPAPMPMPAPRPNIRPDFATPTPTPVKQSPILRGAEMWQSMAHPPARGLPGFTPPAARPPTPVARPQSRIVFDPSMMGAGLSGLGKVAPAVAPRAVPRAPGGLNFSLGDILGHPLVKYPSLAGLGAGGMATIGKLLAQNPMFQGRAGQ